MKTTYWKVELLHDLLSIEKANIILSILLSLVDREDQQVWYYTKNGLFTVKSAYHLHKFILAKNDSEPSKVLSQQGVQKSIWNLKALSGVKIFVLRAYKGILPTLS